MNTSLSNKRTDVCSRFPAQPEWLQVMSDSEVEISSELQWSCAAAGKPRPSIRWLRNGQPLITQVSHIHTRTHVYCSWIVI